MGRDEIIRTLRAAEQALRAQGVRHVAVFGSLARDEPRPESDIDILVDIAPDARMDLFRYAGLVGFIKDMFPAPVDVANRSQLKAHVRPGAERDAIYAF